MNDRHLGGMQNHYWAEWLGPRSLNAASRWHKSRQSLREFYRSGRNDFSDASVVLRCGERLIGSIFARLNKDINVIEIASVSLSRRHRRAANVLALRAISAWRARAAELGIPSLQWRVGSKEAIAYLKRPRFWQRLGYVLQHDPAQQLCLAIPAPAANRRTTLSLRQAMRNVQRYATHDGAVQVGYLCNTPDWQLLEPFWNSLLAATPDGTVFQTYDYQRCWWGHLGWSARLVIVVVLRNETPIAIAPMQIQAVHAVGGGAQRLGFIGLAPESDRPKIIAAAAEAASCATAIAEYLFKHIGYWDRIGLAEQDSNQPFFAALLAQAHEHRYWVHTTAGPECPVVEIQGSWAQFLASRSKNARKSIKRKESALADRSTVVYQNLNGNKAIEAFNDYLVVERNSWKHGTAIATARAPPDLAFYRDLVRRFGRTENLEVRFLKLDAQTIAATFGLLWHGCYYSLHIAHDAKFDDYSPGVVLTARELEEAFNTSRYQYFDFLSGVLPNKGSWATRTTPSTDLFIVKPTWQGQFFFWQSFRFKPFAKRLATRYKLMPFILYIKKTLGRSELDPE
jgi:CelD/BcsL family acetyltransferase involved in cellulose biosynthesis